MNFQSCHKVAFVGLSDSYERALSGRAPLLEIRTNQASGCYIITAETEGAVVRIIRALRKRKQLEMMEGMIGDTA